MTEVLMSAVRERREELAAAIEELAAVTVRLRLAGHSSGAGAKAVHDVISDLKLVQRRVDKIMETPSTPDFLVDALHSLLRLDS